MTQAACAAAKGCYKGDNTACEQDTCPGGPDALITIYKYYDTNANGINDGAGDPPLNGVRFTINVVDATGATINILSPPFDVGTYYVSGANGNEPGFRGPIELNRLGVFPYTITVCEVLPDSTLGNQWINTDPGTLAMCESLQMVAPGDDRFFDFGNLCVGTPGGGHTMGFWSNRNGRSVLETCNGGLAANLQALTDLCLRNANGTNFDPNNYTQYRGWLLSANATNMAYMLSAQLSAMTFNIRNAACMGQFGGGVTNPDGLIFAPGTNCANPLGFASLSCVVTEANSALCANGNTVADSPDRTRQGALKDAIDNANNNLNFVSGTPCEVVYK
jgi:hypothetical protein